MLNAKKLFTKILNYFIEEDLTPSITVSSGQLVSATIKKKCGIVALSMAVKNSAATPNGSNVFTGKINNVKPMVNSVGGFYYGGSHLDLYIDTDGNMTARNTGAQISANTQVQAIIMFVLGGVIKTLKNAISNLYREGVAVC